MDVVPSSTQYDLSLQVDLLPYYSYLLFQNKIPICFECLLKTSTYLPYETLTLKVQGDGFVASSLPIDNYRVGSMRLVGVPIVPDEALLLSIEQEELRHFSLVIEGDGTPLYMAEYPLRLLPYDYWHGSRVMPEMLSGFVLSANPLLSRISLKAAEYLHKWTGDSALSEYQTGDPNQVRLQVAAVYEALRSEGLVYASIPPTFSEQGQRVRLAEEVLMGKLGNCLDLTLLFAACLEYIGLHPLIVLIKGHAFVGCWLINDNHIYPTGDDASYLLKASSNGISEIVLLEATAVCSAEVVPFEDAVRIAERYLHKEDNLEIFVDVFRSRLGHIYPLKRRQFENGKWVLENKGIEHEEHFHQVSQLQRYEIKFSDLEAPSKQVVWERKLLDISLRNNLLNVRLGKKVLPLISFNIHEWEDHLQSSGSFQILGNPSTRPLEVNAGEIYNSALYEEELAGFVLEEMKSQRLHAFLSEDELNDRLKELHRSARTALEENGANSLFLALGLMKWYETDQSTQARYAPILLLPIDIVHQRPSAGGKYTIRSRDEEILLNVTLLEMIKQKFGIRFNVQDILIGDVSGVDVMAALSAMKVIVRDLKRWDVLPEAMLGLFSFSKFVMWNDIHSNADKLRESSIVRALMDGSVPGDGEDTSTPIDVRSVDGNTRPQDLLLPIDIDSSQLAAILDAGRGRSFVLHGPPGTGKSQTITNMIAYALSQGKRVLFVAEKMAALSVVQSRLERIGLGAFCLELHSNKSTKSHILEQLARPLALSSEADRSRCVALSDSLFEQRQRLLEYVEALHRKRPSGYTLYEHINEYVRLDREGISPVLLERYQELDADKLHVIEQELGELALLLDLSGQPYKHPFACLDTAGRENLAPDELYAKLSQYREQHLETRATRERLGEVLGIDIPDSKSGLEACVRLCSAMLAPAPEGWTARDLQMLQDNTITVAWEHAVAEVTKEESIAQEIARWWSQYGQTRGDSLARAEQIRSSWHEAESMWFVPRYFKKRAIVKALRRDLSNTLLEVGQVEMLVSLSDRRADQLSTAIEATPPSLRDYCGEEQRPTEGIRSRYVYAKELYEALELLAESGGSSLEYSLQTLQRISGQGEGCLGSLKAELCSSMLERVSRLAVLEIDLARYVSLRVPQEGYSVYLISELSKTLQHRAGLHDWKRWCDKRRELHARGLDLFVEVLESHPLAPRDAYQAMLMGMHRSWVDYLIASERSLATFNGLLFEQVVARYQTYLREFQQLSKSEILSLLTDQVGRAVATPECSTELTFLKRQINNKGRGKSIRDILLEIPHLLPSLAPCMLMSPISVAQYLSLEGDKFDIVIFDEASQMPTSEAVGAIARGHRLVVVGDPKQMPPTSFFMNQQVDEEYTDYDDMESILDDCISLSMPSHSLSWHYRSKHESLIAFSNAQYYEDKLYTFPSVDDLCSRVRLMPIEGIYDKGRSRSNKIEAQAVVDEIIRRLEDESLRQRSIGVVAFNQSQQNLIEDLLMNVLSKRQDLEAYALQGDEPIFIKNLENVQGDERDVILFSVGYGPDKEGRVSMNFGPLNLQGGERRLNVAVSRARYEMVVFSALRSEHIDLKRTQAKGVEGLKLFLEFAERGTLPNRGVNSLGERQEIVTSLVERLNEHGYKVHTAVGRSGFRVDVAVLDPQDSSRYTLGILCDGLRYYQTKTVQDREVVQPTVLKLLGWELMRLWTVDWYLDKERLIKSVLDQLEAIERGGASSS